VSSNFTRSRTARLGMPLDMLVVKDENGDLVSLRVVVGAVSRCLKKCWTGMALWFSAFQ
jgi:hypothetical protein